MRHGNLFFSYQSSEAIRAEARAWLWQRWQARKPSYLKVKTYGDDGGQEICTYVIGGSDVTDWQVTIKVQRMVPAENSPSKPRRKVIEDELLVAVHVQRIELVTDDIRLPRVFSETEKLPDSTYRLEFLDYGNRAVAIL